MAVTLLAEKILPEQAKTWGMVHEVVPSGELMSTAMMLAEQITQRSGIATGAIKQLFSQSAEATFAQQLQAESRNQTRAGFSPEARDAIMAFLKK